MSRFLQRFLAMTPFSYLANCTFLGSPLFSKKVFLDGFHITAPLYIAILTKIVINSGNKFINGDEDISEGNFWWLNLKVCTAV